MSREEKEKIYKQLKSRFIYSTGLAGERFRLLEYYLKGVEDTLKAL